MRFVSGAFVRVREDRVPRRSGPRRPRSSERQGPPRRRPEYDYLPDADYLDYFIRNDYFDYDDYLDYFLSDSKMTAPNPKNSSIQRVTPTLALSTYMRIL